MWETETPSVFVWMWLDADAGIYENLLFLNMDGWPGAFSTNNKGFLIFPIPHTSIANVYGVLSASPSSVHKHRSLKEVRFLKDSLDLLRSSWESLRNSDFSCGNHRNPM